MKLGPPNPFTLRKAKTGLTILEIFYSQTHFFGKHLKEKCITEATQQLSYKYLRNFTLFASYYQMYERIKQTILSKGTLSVNGLRKE